MVSENQNSSLVSIIVISYNSAEYILETLESAKNQSYKNIELIISDDGSQDDTISICENWLKNNGKRFIDSKVISVSKNTGTPSNCNRGVEASKGEWIKVIAGDDLFFPNAIETVLEYAIKENKKFIVTDVEFFRDNKTVNGYGNSRLIRQFFDRKTPQDKLKYYYRESVFLNSPTYFYHKDVFDINKGYDESFKVLEDNPFIIRTLRNNIDISFLNQKTVRYRLNNSSVTSVGSPLILNDLFNCYKKYIEENLKKGSFVDLLFSYHKSLEYYVKRKGLSRHILFRIYKRASFLFIR